MPLRLISSPAHPPTSDGGLRRRARLLAVAAFLLLGALVAPSPNDRGLFAQPGSRIALSLTIGAAVATMLLLLVGTILFVARRAHRRRTWRDAVFGIGALVVTGALVLAIAALRVAVFESPRGQAARASVANAQTAEARAWSMDVTGVVISLQAPWEARPAFGAAVSSDNLRAARAIARVQEARLRAALHGLEVVAPTHTARLNAMTNGFKHLVRLLLGGYTDAVLGMTWNARHASSRQQGTGGRLIARSRTKFQRSDGLRDELAPRLFALNRLFYGQ